MAAPQLEKNSVAAPGQPPPAPLPPASLRPVGVMSLTPCPLGSTESSHAKFRRVGPRPTCLLETQTAGDRLRRVRRRVRVEAPRAGPYPNPVAFAHRGTGEAAANVGQ